MSTSSTGLTWLRECTPGPLRWATRPYVPAGTVIDIWVSTRPFPRAGIVMSTALFAFYSLLYIMSVYYTYLYRSYPADNEEPLVGNLAFSDNHSIRAWWVLFFQCHHLKTLFFFSLRVWHGGLKERRVSSTFNVQRWGFECPADVLFSPAGEEKNDREFGVIDTSSEIQVV